MFESNDSPKPPERRVSIQEPIDSKEDVKHVTISGRSDKEKSKSEKEFFRRAKEDCFAFEKRIKNTTLDYDGHRIDFDLYNYF